MRIFIFNKKIIIYVILFHFGIILNQYAQKNHIIKEKIIRLPQELSIRRISKLDIDKQGNILICDNFSKKVLLLNQNGKLKNTIEYSSNILKQKWEPTTAYFRNDGKIVVIYYYHGSILFDKNGKNGKVYVNSNYFNKDVIPYFDKGSLRLQSDGHSYFLEQVDEKNKKEMFRIYPKHSLVVPSFGLGGLTADEEGNVFYMEKFVPIIIKYSKYGKFVNAFNKEDSFFKGIKGNLPRKSDVNSLNNLAQKTKDASMVISLDYIENNKLFYQILTNGKYYYQILDTEGNNVLENYNQSDDIVVRAKYNFIISVQKIVSKKSEKNSFSLVFHKVFAGK